MIYEQKLEELHRLVDNLKLHLAYNHPQEAANVLGTIQEKVAVLQEQVSE
jgi:hypothetical protein